MARHIEYDLSIVKKNLVSLFWAKGYAETSLADLEAVSGLNRRQLYNGIGDKRAMFLQAMDAFSSNAGQQFLSPLEQEEAGLRDVANLFEAFLELAAADEHPLGCMVCSTSQDEISADKDVAKRIDSYFDRIRAAYANALYRANHRGELSLSPADQDLRVDMLFGTHVALCILGRAGRPHDQLTRLATQALANLR